MVLFLLFNGYDIDARENQVVRMMRGIMYGKSKESVKRDIKRHSFLIDGGHGKLAKNNWIKMRLAKGLAMAGNVLNRTTKR